MSSSSRRSIEQGNNTITLLHVELFGVQDLPACIMADGLATPSVHRGLHLQLHCLLCLSYISPAACSHRQTCSHIISSPLSTPTVRGTMLCPLPHLHIRRCHHCCLNLNITRTCCTTSASDNRSTIDAVVVCFVLFMRGYIIPVQWSGEIKDPTAVVYLLLPH